MSIDRGQWITGHPHFFKSQSTYLTLCDGRRRILRHLELYDPDGDSLDLNGSGFPLIPDDFRAYSDRNTLSFERCRRGR